MDKSEKIYFKKIFKFLPFILVGLFISNIIFPKIVQSFGPEFNIFPNDPKTLQVANSTTQTGWQPEIQAKAEDVVAFLIYYHNGIDNTVAKNTKIRVDLPKTASSPIKITSFLWADNTSKTIVDTALIKTSEPLEIEYIKGSTKWYKEGSQTPLNLPDGITSQYGVNIGDIKGCWEYAGYVVFQAKLKTPVKISLGLEKKVTNSTIKGDTYNWKKQVSAKYNEIVAFNLFVYNSGNICLSKVRVFDYLPEGLSYIQNSTFLYQNGKKTPLPDGITSKEGIYINNLQPGLNNGAYIVFKAKVNVHENKNLTNSAEAKYDKISAKDYAYINVIEPAILKLELEKTVKNLTKQTLFSKSIDANPGEIVQFKITLKNLGNTELKNVYLEDNLPQELIFQSSSITSQYSNQKLIWYWNKLEKNGIINVYINAKAKELSPGTYRLKNIALTQADGVFPLIDEAFVNVRISPPAPQVSDYYLDKKVINLSGSNNWLDNTEAYPEDILQYKIYFKNIGNKTEEIKITDDLPQLVSYIENSGKIEVKGKTILFSTKLFSTEGIKISLAEGEEGVIYFKVKISPSVLAGSSLKNTAYLVSPTKTLSDSVITIIKQRPTQIQPKIEELPKTGNLAFAPLSILVFLSGLLVSKKRKNS